MIDGDQILVAFAGRQLDALQGDVHRVSAAAAPGATAAGDIDQDPPHHLRGHPEEMAAVLPSDLVPAKQAQARLIDQRGRLQRDVPALTREIAERHAMQLVLNEGQQPPEGLLVPIAPQTEQVGDIAVGRVQRLHVGFVGCLSLPNRSLADDASSKAVQGAWNAGIGANRSCCRVFPHLAPCVARADGRPPGEVTMHRNDRRTRSAVRVASGMAAGLALFGLVLTTMITAERRENGHWVGTWAASPQLAGSPVEINGQTLRQIVHTSAGGERVRVRFSNAYGASDVVIGSAHVAASAGGAAIVSGSDRALRFNGSSTVTIPAGALDTRGAGAQRSGGQSVPAG